MLTSDLYAKSNQLSKLHKELYIFQKHKSSILTDYYELPSISVNDSKNSVVNYYDLVSIFHNAEIQYL